LHARLERRNPAAVLARAEQRLEEARGRLARGVERRLERARGKLAEFARGLVSTNPLAVLARGYSVTSDTSGRTLTDASAVARGDALVTRLARGRLVSRVERVEPGE
jgi:exodeoxyribonuclease VII large subunit